VTLPSIVIGLICSILIGAIFHLWRDGGAGRLFFYFALSLIGFSAGQWLSSSNNWYLFPIGAIDLGLAVPGSLLFLILGDWLSHVELRHTTSDDDGV
jgi:hypothetical protein